VSIYETTFIINPQSDDSTIDQQVVAVRNVITQNGGNILRENRMGTRRLAYMIQGLTQGYYANFIFEAPTSVLGRLERHFKLEEPYVRYLTIRYEGKMPEPEEEVQEEAPAKVHHHEPATRRPEPTPEPKPEPKPEPEAPRHEPVAEPETSPVSVEEEVAEAREEAAEEAAEETPEEEITQEIPTVEPEPKATEEEPQQPEKHPNEDEIL
jgi:small subunit ribosomal protein S6